MQGLKIAGIVVLGAWMAFVTWRIEQVRATAEAACAFALSAATHVGDQIANYDRSRLCPWWVVDLHGQRTAH